MKSSEVDVRTRQQSVASTQTSIECSKTMDKWLLANNDESASIYTFSSGLELADLAQNGDYRLLIGDIGFNGTPKLKVYHGTYLQFENLLVDLPCGVAVVHSDKNELTTSIVVASGSYLYVYRNLKPFYKFSLPALETNQIELDAWMRFKENKMNLATLEEILNNLRLDIGRRSLTSRSSTFLSLPDESKCAFADTYKNQQLKKMNVITCLATLKKTVLEEYASSCLVIGTEHQDVYVLEIEAFTIISTTNLPSVPVFIDANGLYDVEYSILFACRDANIYIIKRGYTSGQLCIQLNSHAVGLSRIAANIYVATMDNILSIYTSKGARIWNMKQTASITALETIFLERQGLHIVAVALSNKTIVFYNDRKCVDVMKLDEIVVAMKFGRFGREDNTLVMISKDGSLIVKILKRTAKFTVKSLPDERGEMGSGGAKLIVPKKTKLFVDQTMREREQYLTMHKTFEHELVKLKLNAARTYVKALQTSLNPVSLNTTESVKLSAKVFGLGPVFQMCLELSNTSVDKFVSSLLIVFEYDCTIYKLEKKSIKVACVQSGITCKFSNRIEAISQLNLADHIKIYIIRKEEEIPLVTAIMNMPRSELDIEEGEQDTITADVNRAAIDASN